MKKDHLCSSFFIWRYTPSTATPFLDASSHIYIQVCPLVRRSVRPSVRRLCFVSPIFQVMESTTTLTAPPIAKTSLPISIFCYIHLKILLNFYYIMATLPFRCNEIFYPSSKKRTLFDIYFLFISCRHSNSSISLFLDASSQSVGPWSFCKRYGKSRFFFQQMKPRKAYF